jgi:ribulose-5-phosphate 4-epimerase/fuculose-1-phosphate aldolase
VANPPELRSDGGLARWEPSITPPIVPGVELDARQSLACALRHLARIGFAEHIAGHITWRRDDGESMWVNPWGLWWAEVRASDVCAVDYEGKVLEGAWDVTPAIHIHTELHKRRKDAPIVIHNHPYYVTLLAATGDLPEIVHQTGTLYDGDLVFVDEYTGEVDSSELGADLAERIGDAPVSILANHGVIITGTTIQEAVFRAACIDRVCRLAYDTMLLGKKPKPIAPEIRTAMKASLLERGADVYWAGAVRLLLQQNAQVLM